jgi:hypothetical protein
MLAAPLSALRG